MLGKVVDKVGHWMKGQDSSNWYNGNKRSEDRCPVEEKGGEKGEGHQLKLEGINQRTIDKGVRFSIIIFK
jgi:hypothetical protein